MHGVARKGIKEVEVTLETWSSLQVFMKRLSAAAPVLGLAFLQYLGVEVTFECGDLDLSSVLPCI
jgi:hypothetical protein